MFAVVYFAQVWKCILQKTENFQTKVVLKSPTAKLKQTRADAQAQDTDNKTAAPSCACGDLGGLWAFAHFLHAER